MYDLYLSLSQRECVVVSRVSVILWNEEKEGRKKEIKA